MSFSLFTYFLSQLSIFKENIKMMISTFQTIKHDFYDVHHILIWKFGDLIAMNMYLEIHIEQ